MNALTASADSFHCTLPRDLRPLAESLDWASVVRRFGSTPGPLRLGSWSTRAAHGGRTTFDATFGIGDAIHRASATSYGPIDAVTSMLYDAGFHLEILSFHQQPVAASDRIATFVLCEFDGRREWAMAIEDDGVTSSIRAIIVAANMLHG